MTRRERRFLRRFNKWRALETKRWWCDPGYTRTVLVGKTAWRLCKRIVRKYVWNGEGG